MIKAYAAFDAGAELKPFASYFRTATSPSFARRMLI